MIVFPGQLCYNKNVVGTVGGTVSTESNIVPT